jgi:Sec-independent protein translocase protein TatA
MEFLGIGPLELILIILIALVILGPKEMEKMSKTVGRSLNKLIKSDIWKDIQSTSDRVKNLPTELMRNAELEELDKNLHEPLETPNKIAPPTYMGEKDVPPLQQDQVVIPTPKPSENETAQIKQDKNGSLSPLDNLMGEPEKSGKKTDPK